AVRDSPDPQLQTDASLARRPDPEKRAALEANRPGEDAVLVRQPVVPDRLPHVPAEHLQPVRLPPGPSAADLTPNDCLGPLSSHLREGQPEALERGLRTVVREHEAALESADRELV